VQTWDEIEYTRGDGVSGIIENNEKKKDGDRKNDDDHTQGDEPNPKE
jgi:hypothetical protein